MKRTLVIFFLLISLFKSTSFAAWGDDALVNRSSYTITNDTLASISSSTIRGGIFTGVVVASSVINGVVTFYDSNGVASSTIGVVSMSGSGNGAFYIPFEVRLSSGLTYTTSGNGPNGISIIYKITRPIP